MLPLLLHHQPDSPLSDLRRVLPSPSHGPILSSIGASGKSRAVQKLDDDVFEKVFKTLAAMANHGPGAVGYVVVGVADDKKTSDRLSALYGVKPVTYQRFLITGVEHEAAFLPKGLDAYYQGITQRLGAAPMSQWAKDQIGRDARLMKYFDKSLVVLRVEAGKEPCAFNGKYYERHGSNVEEVKVEQYTALFGRFLKPA